MFVCANSSTFLRNLLSASANYIVYCVVNVIITCLVNELINMKQILSSDNNSFLATSFMSFKITFFYKMCV